MSKASMFNTVKNFIAKHYGGDTGKMLIHTGVIGWGLSSLAQVAAIVINDKIPKEQKMFLVPQEVADAAVNIASFYLITQSFKSVASKLVKSGKWTIGSVRNFLTKNNLTNKVGKKGFDILKDANLPKDLADAHKNFADGIDVIATTVGSILSCNIVTPVIRNQYAANRQKNSIARMNDKQQPVKNTTFTRNPSMNEFQSSAYNRYMNSSSSLKI